jgi:hypothetical protein
MRGRARRCKRWDEIDQDKKFWVLLASRAQTAKTHVVPLSSIALETLERRRKARTGDAVFGSQSGSPVSNSVFTRVPKKTGIDAGAPHSWRSIFRDWSGDVGRIDRDLAEAALAHSLGATEGAYRRDTAVEARRGPTEAYAKWLRGATPGPTSSPSRRAPDWCRRCVAKSGGPTLHHAEKASIRECGTAPLPAAVVGVCPSEPVKVRFLAFVPSPPSAPSPVRDAY